MRKYIISILSILLTMIFCIGLAFSYWYFGKIEGAAESPVMLKQDDIEENNETTSLSSVYTIYFFPSALYINDYIDYLDKITSTKPEDLYGYIEPSLDDFGNVIYNGNGSVQYDRHSSKMYSRHTYGGDGGYIGEKLMEHTTTTGTNSTDSTDSTTDTNSTTTTTIGSDYSSLYLVEDTKSYISTDRTTRTGKLTDILTNSAAYPTAYNAYTTYYTSDRQYDTLSKTSTVTNGPKKWSDKIYAYYDSDKDGEITDDTKDSFPRYYIGDGDLDETPLDNFKNDTQYLRRNQHVYDRFGAWRYVEYGDGRFMPLKIIVDENFSFEYLSEVMKEPISSMCDNNQWFNLTFSEWAYVDTHTASSEGYTLPYYASIAKDFSGISAKQFRVTNAFKSFDMAQTFDVMQDFSKYADEDNVIRLFPTFSNGKNYIAATDVGNYTSDKNAFGAGVSATTVGGGDTLAADFDFTAEYKRANPLADGTRMATFSTATVETYTNTTTAINDSGTQDYNGKTSAYYSGDSNADNKAYYLYDSGTVESGYYSITYDDLLNGADSDGLTKYYFYINSDNEFSSGVVKGYYQIYLTFDNLNIVVWCRDNQDGSHINYYASGKNGNNVTYENSLTSYNYRNWGFNIIRPGSDAQVLKIPSGKDCSADLGLLLNKNLSNLNECRIFTYKPNADDVITDDDFEPAGTYTPLDSAGTVHNVKYAVWQNINFNNLSNLTFRFQATYGACNWGGTSYSLYNFTSDSLKSIMQTYGDGMYNVYVFMGDAYHEKYNSYGTSGVCIGNIVKDATSSKELFNGELYGKDLLAITGTSGITDYTTSSRSFNCSSLDTSKLDSYRSFVIAVEKVRDIKIITNLNDDSLNMDESANQLTNESKIQSIYDSSNATFSYSSETYYGISLSGTTNLETGAEVNSSGTNVLIKEDSSNINSADKVLNGSFPYIMYLGGVDLTNVTGDYFQLRFGKEYLNNKDINLYFQGLAGVANAANIDANIETTFTSYAPNVALVTTTTIDGKTVLDRVYKNPFGVDGYFTPVVSDKDSNDNTQVFFKLNDGTCKGVYDFLLVYVPETYYTDKDGNLLESIPTGSIYYEHPVGYYIYAHRQSNVFVKILTQDVSEWDNDNNGFVIHKNIPNYPTSSESVETGTTYSLFQKSYYLGLTVLGDDVSDLDNNSGDDVSDLAGNMLLAQSVNKYVKAYLALEQNSGLSITDIILRDHVTTAVVAGYKEVNSARIAEWKEEYKKKYDKDASDDDVNNYFYVVVEGGNATYYELVFEKFVIRKNYIFYVTNTTVEIETSAASTGTSSGTDGNTDSGTDAGSSDGNTDSGGGSGTQSP